ncbi:hypothetical protein JNE12002_32350 [Escherichia coli]
MKITTKKRINVIFFMFSIKSRLDNIGNIYLGDIDCIMITINKNACSIN